MRNHLAASDDSGLPPYVTGTVITVGTFDGVHRGHQDVVGRLVNRSRVLKIPSVLITFEPHPLEIVNPSAAPLALTTHDEKLEVLAETGLNYLAVVPFTPELATYSGVDVVDPVSTQDGHAVSSTSIRRAVAGGDLARAADGLGRPYSASGRVIPGSQRGRTIGFPTLNLGPPPPRKHLPPEGV